MIEPIEGLPSGVVGFEAVGEGRGLGFYRRPRPGHRGRGRMIPGDFKLFRLADRDAAAAWATAN